MPAHMQQLQITWAMTQRRWCCNQAASTQSTESQQGDKSYAVNVDFSSSLSSPCH